jgi:chromosomal replication initiation ATPase DnaA
MTAFGISTARIGRSDAAKRINAAGAAFQRGIDAEAARIAAEAEDRSRAADMRRLGEEAARQRAEEQRRQAEALQAITLKVQAALDRGSEGRIPLKSIVSATAIHFGMSRRDFLSHRRLRSVARPRQIAMFLAKELTDSSFYEIGASTGGRDHSSVIHGVKKIKTLIDAGDEEIAADVDAIRKVLLG